MHQMHITDHIRIPYIIIILYLYHTYIILILSLYYPYIILILSLYFPCIILILFLYILILSLYCQPYKFSVISLGPTL